MEDFKNKAKYNDLSVEIKYPIIGFSTKLKGIKHITDFFQKELEFWMSSTGKGAQPIASFITHFQNCVDQLNAFERNHRDSDDNLFNTAWSHAANTVTASKLNQHHLLSSKSPEGEFVFKVFEEHHTQGLKAYEFITNISLSFTNKDSAIGYLKAYEFLMQDESQIKKRSDSENKVLGRIRSDWNQKTVDLQTEFNANVQTYEE